MKAIAILTVALAGMSAARAAEHLGENFDGMPLGPIAARPGWTGFFAARTAEVSALHYYSAGQSLYLPWNTNSPNATAATHTNLKVALTVPTGGTVRVDFHLYLGNTNIPFVVALFDAGGLHLLQFKNDKGYGVLGFDPFGPEKFPLIVNRFVPVTLFYHARRNQYALEYDRRRVIDWRDSGKPAGVTNFQNLLFMRADDTLASQGQMFVDNVRVETFPDAAWAWWRCTRLAEDRVIEQLGQVRPATLLLPAEASPGSGDLIYDGWHDARNEGATRRLVTGYATNSAATPWTTNWPLEAVVRIATNQNQTLFHWGRVNGFETTNAMIAVHYEAGQRLGVYLRDGQQSTSDYDAQLLAPLPADGRWHHIALVKNNESLSVAVDYQFVNTVALNTHARGRYVFDTGSRVTLGSNLNGANMIPATTETDEIRFSGRVLELHEFLQPGRPLVARFWHDPSDHTINLYFKGILGRAYRIETSPVLGPGETWEIARDDYVVAGTYSFFWAPIAGARRFVRIIRK